MLIDIKKKTRRRFGVGLLAKLFSHFFPNTDGFAPDDAVAFTFKFGEFWVEVAEFLERF